MSSPSSSVSFSNWSLEVLVNWIAYIQFTNNWVPSFSLCSSIWVSMSFYGHTLKWEKGIWSPILINLSIGFELEKNKLKDLILILEGPHVILATRYLSKAMEYGKKCEKSTRSMHLIHEDFISLFSNTKNSDLNLKTWGWNFSKLKGYLFIYIYIFGQSRIPFPPFISSNISQCNSIRQEPPIKKRGEFSSRR